MKTKIIGLIGFILLSITTSYATERIKGNGKIETRTIQVDEYDQLILGQGIEFQGMSGLNFKKNKKNRYPSCNYSQTAGKATLEISLDENLFSWLIVDQKDGKLWIKAENDIQLKPTQMIINGSSKELKNVVVSGCMDFRNKGSLSSGELRLSVDGVGDIILKDISVENLTSNVSGVGNIHLSGQADKGNYYVSGVGKIFAYDCNVKELKCEVSGVGRMEVRASEKLNAGTSGVGGIKYKGNAEVDSWSSGIGKVKSAN